FSLFVQVSSRGSTQRCRRAVWRSRWPASLSWQTSSSSRVASARMAGLSARHRDHQRCAGGGSRSGRTMRSVITPIGASLAARAGRNVADGEIENELVRREIRRRFDLSGPPGELLSETQIGGVLLDPDELDGEWPGHGGAAGGVDGKS